MSGPAAGAGWGRGAGGKPLNTPTGPPRGRPPTPGQRGGRARAPPGQGPASADRVNGLSSAAAAGWAGGAGAQADCGDSDPENGPELPCAAADGRWGRAPGSGTRAEPLEAEEENLAAPGPKAGPGVGPLPV